MKDPKNVCRNMNHGRLNPPIGFCPSCGDKFKHGAFRSCDMEKHRNRRKQGDSYCCDCGKNLKAIS